jgi:hypothetical protein
MTTDIDDCNAASVTSVGTHTSISSQRALYVSFEKERRYLMGSVDTTPTPTNSFNTIDHDACDDDTSTASTSIADLVALASDVAASRAMLTRPTRSHLMDLAKPMETPDGGDDATATGVLPDTSPARAGALWLTHWGRPGLPVPYANPRATASSIASTGSTGAQQAGSAQAPDALADADAAAAAQEATAERERGRVSAIRKAELDAAIEADRMREEEELKRQIAGIGGGSKKSSSSSGHARGKSGGGWFGSKSKTKTKGSSAGAGGAAGAAATGNKKSIILSSIASTSGSSGGGIAAAAGGAQTTEVFSLDGDFFGCGGSAPVGGGSASSGGSGAKPSDYYAAAASGRAKASVMVGKTSTGTGTGGGRGGGGGRGDGGGGGGKRGSVLAVRGITKTGTLLMRSEMLKTWRERFVEEKLKKIEEAERIEMS